jgi:hypothetical protein
VSSSVRCERARDGALVVRLYGEEIDILRQLGEELGQLLASPVAGDPVTDRLFPRAYLDPTEEDAETEWQRLVHPDLVESRVNAVTAMLHTLPADVKTGELAEARLDPEQEEAWLRMLNDTRLATGTRLGVTEDSDLEHIDPNHPDAFVWYVYVFLLELESEIVGVLLGEMPGGPADV